MSSIIAQATGTIIDRGGRTRYTPQYKQEVLAAFESSSFSATAFAAQCVIKDPTLGAGKGRTGGRAGSTLFPDCDPIRFWWSDQSTAPIWLKCGEGLRDH